jgi:capsular exopolysaccharide synthesis family protein
MKIIDYLKTIWRRKYVILITTGVAMAVIAVGTLVSKSTYTASAILRIATVSGGTVSFTDFPYANTLLNTYQIIITSQPILEAVDKQLNLQSTSIIKAQIIPNTELIQITVDDRNPQRAFETINALVTILLERSDEFFAGTGKSSLDIMKEQIAQVQGELQNYRDTYDKLLAQNPQDAAAIASITQSIELNQQIYATLLTQYEQVQIRETVRKNAITIVEPATLPLSPSKPNKLLNLAIGFLASLAAGLVLVLLFENIDQTLYTTDSIENISGLHSLGVIPKMKSRKGQLPNFADSRYLDAFYSLCIQVNRSKFPHSILITSTEQGEGKSTIAFHLARILTLEGKKVVIVDCNLRNPVMQTLFNLPTECGLSDYLMGNVTLDAILQENKDFNIQVITIGSSPDQPALLLNSEKMHKLIPALAKRFDIILLDAPIALGLADVRMVAPDVDQVVLVVKCGKVQEENLKAAVQQLTQTWANSLGIIVNEDDALPRFYP